MTLCRVGKTSLLVRKVHISTLEIIMQEAKDSTLSLSEEPHRACKATREELQIPGVVNVMRDCPACLAYGTRCFVAAHPSAAAMTGN